MPRRYVPITAFVLAYMGAAAVLAFRQGNKEFVLYGLIMLAMIATLVWLDRRVGLSTPLLWGLAVWGGMHMMGGTAQVPPAWTDPGVSTALYNLRVHPDLPKYDQFVHAYGFFVASLVAWRALRVSAPTPIYPTAGVLVAIICLGMGLGALNEVVEFAATRVMATNVGGYDNTGWDLVSNLVGCVLAAAWVRFTRGAVPAEPRPEPPLASEPRP